LKLPLGGVDCSMNSREMKDWGCVADKFACVGATAAAVPLSALKVAVDPATEPLVPPTVPRSTVSAKLKWEPEMEKIATDKICTNGFLENGQLIFMSRLS